VDGKKQGDQHMQANTEKRHVVLIVAGIKPRLYQ
jgi:hypothetical protein